MVPWFVAWGLRKAAVIPVVIISAVAVGASYGSFDLTYRVLRASLPRPKKMRKYTRLASSSSAITAMLITAGFREALFPPVTIAPPNLPFEGVPLDVRIRNATAVFLHQVINYPYGHRFQTAFIAGSIGGVVGALAEWLYNRERVAKEKGRLASSGPEEAPSVAPVAGNFGHDEMIESEHVDTFVAQSNGAEASPVASRQSEPPAHAASSSHWHGSSSDPLAALGLYGPTTGAGAEHEHGRLGSAGRGIGALHAGMVGQQGDHDSEFLESYSDSYSGAPVDRASRMDNFEEGGPARGPQAGSASQAKQSRAESSGWDPYAARQSEGEDGGIQYETPPKDQPQAETGGRR